MKAINLTALPLLLIHNPKNTPIDGSTYNYTIEEEERATTAAAAAVRGTAELFSPKETCLEFERFFLGLWWFVLVWEKRIRDPQVWGSVVETDIGLDVELSVLFLEDSEFQSLYRSIASVSLFCSVKGSEKVKWRGRWEILHGPPDVVVPPFAESQGSAWEKLDSHHTLHQQNQKHLFMDERGLNWDDIRFVARPSRNGVVGNSSRESNVEENLALKLGDNVLAPSVDEWRARTNKRVRQGSSGDGGSFPACQVDDCKVNLLSAKDYHRRHKVCESHSKCSNALVGKQMQRFCQQCSRFHLLAEFDKGKRSCRRRLAGHNRRRRKIQPEDDQHNLQMTGTQDNRGSEHYNKLLSVLAYLQGNGMDPAITRSTIPDKDHLVTILSNINTNAARNATAESSVPRQIDFNILMNHHLSKHVPNENGSSSTLDLLAVLSTPLKDFCSRPSNFVAQGSSDSSGDGKSQPSSSDPSSDTNSCENPVVELHPIGHGKGHNAQQESFETADHQIPSGRLNLSLQLFSTTDDNCEPKGNYSKKSSQFDKCEPKGNHSLRMEKSPPASLCQVNNSSPLNSLLGRGEISVVEKSTSLGRSSLVLSSRGSEEKIANNIELQELAQQERLTSSMPHDQSPSSSNSDAQDRTERIIFKLSEKHPADIPETLRTQILDWLSFCPSEMESYIRPGCVVVSVYLSMESKAWKELKEDLLQRVHLLLQYSDSDFWRSGCFLTQIDQKLAFCKDGKVHHVESWDKMDSPQLMSVSPLAVVSGKETPLLLKGRNLTLPGTRFHCTYMGGYVSKEVSSTSSDSSYGPDLESFDFPRGIPNAFGRVFVEVENGLRGNSFPVIIADENICLELKDLESEFQSDRNVTPIIKDGQGHSVDDIMHFLNELGWLFQRMSMPSNIGLKDFSCTRFKFILSFAVERDWLGLVTKLLDTLVEWGSHNDELVNEAILILLEIQLLNHAVRRKCRKMIELLLHYSVKDSFNASVYFFSPDNRGPAGITSLHLVASMQRSEDIVDALTNDPQEIGLNCWDSLKDDKGQTPYAYASATNNHSYNKLVARKLVDKRNFQQSIDIKSEDVSSVEICVSTDANPTCSKSSISASCAQCAIFERRKQIIPVHRKGLLYRPFAYSLLTVAAVCVCVCLFLRGRPEIDSVAPFKWGKLGYGPL